MNKKSPYLEHHRRLADIINAIQVLGSYPNYASRELANWVKRLGDPVSATDWSEVVKDHPEFFRVRKDVDEEGEVVQTLVSLNWRWSQDKDYAPLKRRILSQEELEINKGKPKNEQIKLTKRPLDSDQIEVLVNTAISLHDSAIVQSL